MDFKVDTIVILIFMIVFGMVIMAVATPLLLWNPYQQNLDLQTEVKIENIEGLDIARLSWNISTPGSDILNLIEGDGGQEFYIFVQTRGQNGRVVNYGRQLRQSGSQDIHINAGVLVPGTLRDEWVYHYVISARDLFGFNDANQLVDTEPINRPPFNQLVGDPTGTDITTHLNGSARTAVNNVIHPGSENQEIMVWSDPRLSFFDPTLFRDVAHNQGKTFTSTGTLFTGPRALQTGNINQNTTRARVQESLWYINGVAHFLSIAIVDPQGELIGFYFEEHGVIAPANFLAMAFELGEPIICGEYGGPINYRCR
ncbi:MAG: hypothetical protein FWE27_04930 [Defluviitaleaceae bacterium]|nr:hypothetical protein [Defluviitaleaceae bacterium]